MKIGLTGGTGFVGRSVLRRFVNAGHQVTALVRSGPSAAEFAGEGVRTVSGDILDPSSLSGAFDGCDAVVHLVGIIRERPGATFDSVHVQGTENVLQAAVASGVRRIVHMSAAGTRPEAASRYHQTKWQAEEAVRKSALEWTILRPSLIFGKGDGFTTMLIDLVRRAPVIPVIGSGENLLQPIAVDDVGAAFLASAEANAYAGKTCELGGPERLPFETIVRTIARQMGSRKPLVHIPIWTMSTAAAVLSRVTSRFPLTPDQLIMLGEDNIAEPNHARDVFQLLLTPFGEGLKRILAP